MKVAEAAVSQHTSGASPQEAEGGVAVSCAPREVPSSAVFPFPVFFSSLSVPPLRSQRYYSKSKRLGKALGIQIKKTVYFHVVIAAFWLT